MAIKANVDYDCINAVYEDDSWLSDQNIMDWTVRYKNYAILGTGGSSLSGQAIKCACGNKNVAFVDNVCPYEFYEWLNSVDISNTGLVVISKSGETIETLAQIQLVLQRFKSEIEDHLLIITEDKGSTLRRIGLENHALYIEHPKTIGGRFSAFSAVGMFPAHLMGLQVSELKAGAIDALESKEWTQGASFVKDAYIKGITNQVFMFYSPRLRTFGRWLEQLYAESSGKDGTGITPLLATGTTDQHSKLQLYLGGQKNKAYSVFIENDDIEELQFNDNTLPEYLRQRSLGQLFSAEAQATCCAIRNRGLPLRTFNFDKITEYELGWLFMHFMLEVITVCKEISVNPFDQPNVEEGKRMVKEMMLSYATQQRVI